MCADEHINNFYASKIIFYLLTFNVLKKKKLENNHLEGQLVFFFSINEIIFEFKIALKLIRVINK